MVSEPHSETKNASPGRNQLRVSEKTRKEDTCLSPTQSFHNNMHCYLQTDQEGIKENHVINDEPITPKRIVNSLEGDESQSNPQESTVWLCCDVYDTGIGIPGKSLFVHRNSRKLYNEDFGDILYQLLSFLGSTCFIDT